MQTRLCLAIVTSLFLSVQVPSGQALAGQNDRATEERPSEIWSELRGALFEDRQIAQGAGMIELDAPYRAFDAAMVPVSVRVDPGAARRVTRLTLIVDENPAPVAAAFEFFDGMGEVIALSTRLRVNAYSNVRVVAELDDGSLYQYARFVKASGGCAAPASKDAEAALALLGKMKIRHFEPPQNRPAGERRETQVMIRHPNNSGFQLDQVTQLYIPAFFVNQITVSQGEEPLFQMEGGISLSEDPAIRFEYVSNGAAELSVSATDTDGGRYQRAFAMASGS